MRIHTPSAQIADELITMQLPIHTKVPEYDPQLLHDPACTVGAMGIIAMASCATINAFERVFAIIN